MQAAGLSTRTAGEQGSQGDIRDGDNNPRRGHQGKWGAPHSQWIQMQWRWRRATLLGHVAEGSMEGDVRRRGHHSGSSAGNCCKRASPGHRRRAVRRLQTRRRWRETAAAARGLKGGHAERHSAVTGRSGCKHCQNAARGGCATPKGADRRIMLRYSALH